MNRFLCGSNAALITSCLKSQPQLLTDPFVRRASLSAIHRGLRRSERVQYGSNRPRDESPVESAMKSNRRDSSGGRDRTSRAMAGAASPRQQSKLRKKLSRKEKEREEEDEDGRQTRRKRFNNPEKEFGKGSLVYQLKYGVLKDEVPIHSLQQPVRPRPRDHGGLEKRAPTGSGHADARGPGRPDANESRNNGLTPWDRRGTRDNPAQSFDKRSSRDSQTLSRYTRDSRDSRPQSFDRRDSGRDSCNKDSAGGSTYAPRKMMPMAIKYTTAASQFLYGRSVVKAALEESRRKLYNLYVYGGENRVDSFYNASMIRLAESRGVPVTIVPNDQQRLMDKMSMGRPHNGFVLETSPLPQIPVTSLGRVEETFQRFGFHINLAHQTREEEVVNGKDGFIKRDRDRTYQPMVLLLHEIVDPGNLGALLRTASYFGVDAVGITSRSSSNLTPVVLKSAAGAVEEITIFSVDSTTEFIERSQNAGWTAYAAVAPPQGKLVKMHGEKFMSTDEIEKESPLVHKPCILVLGNEGHGLPRPVKVAADYELSIPRVVSESCVDSLNVSVAGALLCHAFVKGAQVNTTPAKQVNPFEEMIAAAEEKEADPEAVEKAEEGHKVTETERQEKLF